MKQISGCLDRTAPFTQRRRPRQGAFPLPFSIALALLALPGAHVPLAAASPPLAPGTIITIAGNGQNAFSGDGGPAAQAGLGSPIGIALDTAGDLFIAAAVGVDRVRRISPSGIITTVAGTGSYGYSGDNGPATQAQLYGPNGLALDAAGNLYISDIVNNRIRKVDTGGIITTVAGGGSPADGVGDGGPATNARLNRPVGLALDARGNLFIGEFGGQRVRMVSPAGTITTVAGTGQAGFAGDGGPAAAAQLDSPVGLAVDGTGHLYIADFGSHRVRMVGPDGIIRTVAGGGNPADGQGDGGLATDARLDTPEFLALDGAGNLFIADNRGARVRRVGMSEAGAGIISTVAGTGKAGFSGDGGPAPQAQLSGPFGLAIDQAGNLFFADIGRVTPDGTGFDSGNSRIREVVGAGVPG